MRSRLVRIRPRIRAGSRLADPVTGLVIRIGLDRFAGSTDVLGLAASATVKGNDISIMIPIVYIGQPRSSWNTAIESRWSGVFGDVNVTTMVTSGNAMSVDTNVITVTGPGLRSKTSWFSKGGGQDTGLWASDASDDIVGHEAGHILHLIDQYTDVVDPSAPGGLRSVPNPGYENNIMSNSSKRPSEADFFRIMNNKLICH